MFGLIACLGQLLVHIGPSAFYALLYLLIVRLTMFHCHVSG